jgi:tetratricopeptide (TPR) repeat protein
MLPRWRALARTPAHELPTSKVAAKSKTRCKEIELKNALTRWEKSKSLADASDLIDAALLTGQYPVAAPAALGILVDGNGVDGLNDAARQILGDRSDRPTPELSFADERDPEKIAAKIGALKWRLNTAPRDALTSLEIARLQSLIGQTRSAERYIERAIKAAPNDRYVLRSAARFWAHRSSPGDEQVERALKVIWASDVVRGDPWVQAAEVALANICRKTPRYAMKTGREILSSEPNSVQFSELAGGLATLELHHGAPLKKVRKFTRISLRAPTENSLAQAMWARKDIGMDFDVQGYLKKVPNASEASARAAYETGDYQMAETECWHWLEDENFSARAALTGSYVSSCLLSQYEKSLAFTEQGLRANPNEPMLINSKVFSLAYLWRLDEALAFLPHLDAFEHNKQMRPYIRAAHGLIAFRQGNYFDGRAHYKRAMDDAKELKLPSLAANAAIYWVEQELRAGTSDRDEVQKVIAQLDEFYNRKEYFSGKATTWASRKKVISALLDESDKRKTEREVAKSAAMEAPLLMS